jgi:hypothetical protein
MSVSARNDSGRWEERGHAGDYLRKSSIHCSCCGRMLVRRAWVSVGRVFCEPECEQLYRDYWIPRHGASAQ